MALLVAPVGHAEYDHGTAPGAGGSGLRYTSGAASFGNNLSSVNSPCQPGLPGGGGGIPAPDLSGLATPGAGGGAGAGATGGLSQGAGGVLPTPGGSDAPPAQASASGASLFATRCNSCHGSNRPAIKSSGTVAAARVASGSMPPGGGLSETEKKAIGDYLKAGAASAFRR